MSPFAKLMLRFGWIRLSSYGLEVTLDGRLVSARLLPEAQLDLDWGNVPAPTIDLASTFDPALAAIPALSPSPSPPPSPPPLPLPAPRSCVAATVPGSQATPVAAPDDALSEEEEERAWQAAVARAKAGSESESPMAPSPPAADDEATAFADTEKLPGSAVRQRPQPEAVEPEGVTQVAAELDENEDEDEDWEVLVAAARSRASHPTATSDHPCSSDDTKIEALPQVPDFAAAQVTRDALPANDDLPADTVTSINAIRLRSLPAVRQPSASSEDDEWTAMRRQIEAKEREENARKMRAMREIQRLQGRGTLGGFKASRLSAPPHRKRMAAGTSPAPGSRPVIAASPLPTRRPSPPATPISASGDDTNIDLPRVTERLSR